MTGVDGLLGKLNAGGTLDSHGTFTIDLKSAQEKLEKYRLATPQHYILSLLSAAIHSGAKTFLLERSGAECRVGFDGRPYIRSELKGLIENMVLGTMGADPRLNDLGIALQGARSLKPRSLRIESSGAEKGVLLSVESNRVTIAPAVPSEAGGFVTQFRVKEGSYGPVRVFLAGLGLTGQEEAKLLKKRARYATCEVFVGSEKINNNRLGPWTLAAKLEGGPQMPKFALSSERLFPIKSDDTVSGYIGFGPEVGGWIIVENGTTFQLSTEHSIYPTSRAVLYTKGLNQNLSGTGLVQNKMFQLLAGVVDKHLDSLVLRTKSCDRGLSLEAKELLKPLVTIARSRRAVQV